MRTILLIAAASLSATAAMITIDPTNTTLNVSDVVRFEVGVDDIVDLYAFQVDLQFDPTKLEAVSVAAGTFLPGAFFVDGFIDNTAGSITGTIGTLVGASSGETGSGTLATVTFRAIAPGISVKEKQCPWSYGWNLPLWPRKWNLNCSKFPCSGNETRKEVTRTLPKSV